MPKVVIDCDDEHLAREEECGLWLFRLTLLTRTGFICAVHTTESSDPIGYNEELWCCRTAP